MIICYTVPEIWHESDAIIFHFGLFISLLHPNSPKQPNFKKQKTLKDIITLLMCTKNYD